MHAAKVLLFLAAGASASILADPVRVRAIEARGILQGWSLQSATCPTNTNSCGAGSCCPASLNCIAASNDEVAACCPTTADCHGAVEGAPACADSTWNLYKGLNGNGFCCMQGMVGIYDYHNPVAGSCVAAAAADATLAVLASTGAAVASTAAAGGASTAAAGGSTATASAGPTAAVSGASTGPAATGTTSSATGTSPSSIAKSGAEKTSMGLATVVIAFVAMVAF